ncbi:hypothetical protein [Pseudidiomarina donghaiensis]|uniref:hypothetical protein n=1 Tax=Pseudidiomarina donghaiensis TaxID=519452 RepID=UPI003A9849E0
MKHILILTIAACTFATVNTWAQHNSQALEPELQQIEAHLPNELGPAQRLVERLLEQYPEDPQVNYYCGVIYGLRAGEGMLSAMRNASRSRKCTEKAVALEPTNMKYQLAAMLQADSALSEHPEIRAAQLNARYQVARNAVFSGIDVQDGIQSTEAYILAFDNDLELPELAWAHARMAQLMKLDNNEAGVETHRQLAQQLGQENDKALYELLDRL